MVSSITIQPQRAANAGCSASYRLGDTYSDEHGWSNEYIFTATPAEGWHFWKWIVTIKQVEEGPGGQTGTFTKEHTSNPITEYEDYSDWSYISGYGIYSHTVTNVIAIFWYPTTRLILHSPSNLQIIHGSEGRILTDD